MKNIIKTLMLSLLLVNVGCENEDMTSVTSGTAPELLNPGNGTAFVLRPGNGDELAATFVWNHAEYGVQAGVNYKVEFAKGGTNFETVIDGGSPANNQKFKSYTVNELNGFATEAGLAPFANGDLEVRIKSWLGDNGEMVEYSNVVTLKVNRFTNDLPKLAVPGNHQGWTPSTAERIASSAFGKTDYEGFMWLDGEFKFVAPNADGAFAWPDQGGGANYGDNGDFSGILAESGGNITAAAGYYMVKANPGAVTPDNQGGMKYNVTMTNWGVVGNATPGGWDNSTPMTYDPATKKWSVTVAMIAQTAPSNGWKFRANNAWDINLGDNTVNSTDGTLRFGGENIGITTAGTYKIVLDLSNPRKYTYTITQQ